MKFPLMLTPVHNAGNDPLTRRALFGTKNPKHTWVELAREAGVPRGYERDFLWNGSAYPFASPRYIYGQLRHVLRHKVCFDNPGAACQSRSLWRHA